MPPPLGHSSQQASPHSPFLPLQATKCTLHLAFELHISIVHVSGVATLRGLARLSQRREVGISTKSSEEK
jgi:hypothetical protein